MSLELRLPERELRAPAVRISQAERAEASTDPSAEKSSAASPRRSLWRRLHNRGARPALDAAVLLSSSRMPIRLRGWGRALTLGTCLAEDDRGRVLAYGEQAEVMEGRAPAGVVLSRPIQEGRITDLDGGKFLLEKLLSGSKHGVVMGPRLLVGVASHLSPLERKTVEEVTRAAGARSVSLVDQCLLGILGADRDPFSSGELVVDLGAGHGEVALVSRGCILHTRTIAAIGSRLDAAVKLMVEQKYGLNISTRQAERLKLTLGSAVGPTSRQAEVSGCDVVSGMPSSAQISAEHVQEALQPLLAELLQEVRQVLKEAPPQLVSDVCAKGALLIGGGARLPGLEKFLQQHLHLAFVVPPEPELATQRGLDRALAEPAVRRRLLRQGKALLAPTSSGRLTEKLIGLAAVAMLLFASYFPSDKAGSLKPLTGLVDGLAPMWSSLRASAQPIAEEQFQEAQVREKERQLRQLAEENKTLRKLTGAPKAKGAAWDSGPGLPARVVARAAQSWDERLVIDVGSKHGVKSGMAAVSNNGLVGRVQSVTETSARVALISSGAAEMGARVQRTRSSGVIKTGKDGSLELHFLDPDDGVRAGDVVVTSGLDGVYPAGIPVGKVELVYRPDNEVYMAARVKPLPDLNKLEAVLLVGGKQV